MVNHIVHLEDDHHLFSIFRVALEIAQPSLKIVQFTEAEQLLNYVVQATTPVDVVILDIRVPGKLNGIQVAQQLRKMQYQTNIIITSAYSAPERRVLSEIDALFIPKPWNISAMIHQILDLDLRLPIKRTSVPKSIVATNSGHFLLQAKSTQRVTAILDLLQLTLKVDTAAVLISQTSTARIENVIMLPASRNTGKGRLFIESFATQIIEQQKPLFVEDVRRYINRENVLENIVSYAGLPFGLSDTGYQGVLCVTDNKVRKWKDTDYDILRKTASLLLDTLETDQFLNMMVARNDALHSYSSTIAHDLKAPLGAIIGYADIVKLLLGDELPEHVHRYLTSITDSATIMSDMITRLLWLAKLDHPLASSMPVEMGLIVEAAVTRLRYQIERRGVNVILPKEYPTVVGHDAWIEEVFANLLSNAIKYMGDDNRQPTVEIRWFSMDDCARFEVADNGIGISAEDQTKLFNSFSRLNKVSVEGLGLGLVIVQRIITNLNGQLGVESAAGAGSTFWFTLPLAREQ
jgi:DNA-binding response OmpR family regulator